MALRGYLIFLGVALAAVVGFAAALPAVASYSWSISVDAKPSAETTVALVMDPEAGQNKFRDMLAAEPR